MTDGILCRTDLRTYDPYDIWKTPAGFRAKDFYNRHPLLGLAVVGPLAFADHFFDRGMRRLYTPIEYPIVRAMASLSALNLYGVTADRKYLSEARRHLDWLLDNTCRGYSGNCWGLGFRYAVRRDIVYEPNTPLTTMTPYAMEAFHEYSVLTGEPTFRPAIESVMRFFDRDVHTMIDDGEKMATSYAPFPDRVVVNAVSYAMLANAIYLSYCPRFEIAARNEKIGKLYEYVRSTQRSDGSWFYSMEGKPFIDCFHTCIVLKNIIKTTRSAPLPGSGEVIAAGYSYLKTAFLDEDRFLFRRFSQRNKPGLERFDLYDNAEALNLALLMGDQAFAERLLESTIRAFGCGQDVYSQIDFIGVKRKINTLRWALMPFVYSASCVLAQMQHVRNTGIN